MDEQDQSHFKLRSGSMLNLFLESKLLEQIKQIQKNENLKDESEVVIRAIQHYYEKNILDVPRQQDQFENEFSQTTFDGNIDIKKLEKIIVQIKSENLIKKLPQHQIYNNIQSAGMIHRFQTKILPVKFSLMCLSKIILEQNRPWVDLNELKNYTLESAKIFIKKFDSSSIRNKFKVKTGFPILKISDFKSDHDSYLSYVRSSKRFTEEFVGRKLQKREGVQMGGACFEMGLIKAKTTNYDEVKNSGKIYVTLSDTGKEFVSYKNHLIDFVYKNIQDEPSSIFSQQEREFYFRKILPEFKFENIFVEHLMKNEQIKHTREIKEWFKEEFLDYRNSMFPDMDVSLEEDTIRIYSNTIMGRLMEFDVFTKDPKSKSGPYSRRYNMSDLR
jgi:hypothetical protein